jgi:hypothetical protein
MADPRAQRIAPEKARLDKGAMMTEAKETHASVRKFADEGAVKIPSMEV